MQIYVPGFSLLPEDGGDNFLPRSHNDLAALRHGVAGIHREIEERHLELVCVRQHRFENERKMSLYPDRCANGPLKEIRHPAHELRYVDDLLFELLVSREGEHALGQGRASLRALGCVFQQRDAFGIIRQSLAQKLEAAEHRRQQVVEIVGDAAGQLADRLHLLRLH